MIESVIFQEGPRRLIAVEEPNEYGMLVEQVEDPTTHTWQDTEGDCLFLDWDRWCVLNCWFQKRSEVPEK